MVLQSFIFLFQQIFAVMGLLLFLITQIQCLGKHKRVEKNADKKIYRSHTFLFSHFVQGGYSVPIEPLISFLVGHCSSYTGFHLYLLGYIVSVNTKEQKNGSSSRNIENCHISLPSYIVRTSQSERASGLFFWVNNGGAILVIISLDPNQVFCKHKIVGKWIQIQKY